MGNDPINDKRENGRWGHFCWAIKKVINDKTISIGGWMLVLVSLLIAFFCSYIEIKNTQFTACSAHSPFNEDENSVIEEFKKIAKEKSVDLKSVQIGDKILNCQTTITSQSNATCNAGEKRLNSLMYVVTVFVVALCFVGVLPLWCSFHYREYN